MCAILTLVVALGGLKAGYKMSADRASHAGNTEQVGLENNKHD